MERLFNLRAGLTSADDTLPERLLKCPIQTGASKGEVNRLHEMLPEYYQLRGWDTQGVPTEAKMQELALA
jgi:aldehyde:ferredoxin oxidoreductase